MKFLSESLTVRIKEQVKDQLLQILPKEVSNFAPPVIEKLIKESRDEVTLEKVVAEKTRIKMQTLLLDQTKEKKDKDKDADPSAGSD
ncbi:hypothetical protein Tco_1462986 [Tanacetum coccineum]